MSDIAVNHELMQKDQLNALCKSAVMLKALEDRIKEARSEVAQALDSMLDPGDVKRPSLATGGRAGTVSKSKSEQVPRVDATRQDFVDWVARTYPEQVELVMSVRPEFVKRLVVVNDEATSNLEAHVVAPDGEIDPPGTYVGWSRPYVSVRTEKQNVPYLWAEITAVIHELLPALENPQ